MGKRVVTKTTIDELLASGARQVVLDPGDIVTALAREYAQERGVRLVPAGAAACAAADVSSAGASSTAEDAEAIRRALVAALGYEPDDLAGIIERALR